MRTGERKTLVRGAALQAKYFDRWAEAQAHGCARFGFSRWAGTLRCGSVRFQCRWTWAAIP